MTFSQIDSNSVFWEVYNDTWYDPLVLTVLIMTLKGPVSIGFE